MSSKDSDQDLTRVLDGWVPGGAQREPPIDPTRVLDGWSADSGRPRARAPGAVPLAEEVPPALRRARCLEAVLLHEPGLHEFQLKELRAFVDAEKLAQWERLNKAYKLPASGQPIERI